MQLWFMKFFEAFTGFSLQNSIRSTKKLGDVIPVSKGPVLRGAQQVIIDSNLCCLILRSRRLESDF